MYWNDKSGVKDCSRGNTYHNKHFRDLAAACDLNVACHPTYGWSITSPTDELFAFCVENGLTEIRLCRLDLTAAAISGTGTHAGTFALGGAAKKSSTRKYICPCCGMSVRATKAVNIACLDCDETMLPAC